MGSAPLPTSPRNSGSSTQHGPQHTERIYLMLLATQFVVRCSILCSKFTKIRLSAELRPYARWGNLQHSPEPRGPGAPLSSLFPLVHSLSHFCSFLLFPFYLFSFALPIFFFCPFLPHSTRVVPLHFQVGGHRKQPNLGLVCCVYFMSVSYTHLTLPTNREV